MRCSTGPARRWRPSSIWSGWCRSSPTPASSSPARVRRVLLQRRSTTRASPTRSTRCPARRARRSRSFPMPRNTAMFEPTFRGEGIVRSDDILAIRATARTRPITACRRGICRCAAISPCRSSRARARCWAACSSAIPQPGVFTDAGRAHRRRHRRAGRGRDRQCAALSTPRSTRSRRRKAEQACASSNETLEQRVAERTASWRRAAVAKLAGHRAPLPAPGRGRHRLRASTCSIPTASS